MTPTSTLVEPHGPDVVHAHGRCSMLACRDAHNARQRNRRRMMAYGQWQPTVDAKPVRALVRNLLEHAGPAGAAARTVGLCVGTVEVDDAVLVAPGAHDGEPGVERGSGQVLRSPPPGVGDVLHDDDQGHSGGPRRPGRGVGPARSTTPSPRTTTCRCPPSTTSWTTWPRTCSGSRSSDHDYSEALSDGPAVRDAHARSAMQAWRAYRLLQALCQIDPRAVELILPRIGEQLEAGDFAEIAHEEAHRLGHSPQQWLDDYTAARAAQKARAPVGNESTTG